MRPATRRIGKRRAPAVRRPVAEGPLGPKADSRRSLAILTPDHKVPRERLVDLLATVIASLRRDWPVLVGIDGPDGAGKTVLANDVASNLRQRGGSVERISLDHFHRPAIERYQRGRDSPEGFYLDSFDVELFRRLVLGPLSPNGTRRFVRAAFDHVSDQPVHIASEVAPSRAVVIIDGLFLHIPELRDVWDLSIFVTASPRERLRRMLERDGGGRPAARRFWRRYAPGQELYVRDARPVERASIAIDNEHVELPRIVSTRGPILSDALSRTGREPVRADPTKSMR
jgi:uridine kinase